MGLRHKYFNLRSLRRSRRSLLISILVFVFILVFAVVLTYEKLINYYAYDLLGRTMQKTIELRTDGLYSITYDSIDVDFFNSRATLYDFEVKLDSSLIKEVEDRTLFSAKVPRLDADIINLLEIVFKDELRVRALALREPEVWISQPRSDTSNIGISKESGDIYNTVTEQIKAFNLGEFKVEQAQISYKREVQASNYDFVASNISFVIKNFGWDAKKDTDSKFFTDHIRLVLKDQTVKLKDSIHEVTFDSVMLSTQESRVNLQNVHLYPRYDRLNNPDLEGENAYYAEIPQLSIRGLDFGKAYDENILDIDSIDLISPKFAMDNFHGKNNKGKLSPSTEQLIKIIAQLFNVIQVSNVNIEDGDINILRDREASISRFKANNIFAQVKNVKIDTLAYSEIAYDSASVGLKNYMYTMPDSVHVLKFGSLFFTTTDKSYITVDSLQVFDRLTVKAKKQQGGVVNINAPHMEVSGFEFEKFVDNNEMIMGQVSIYQPDIQFYLKENKKSNKEELDLPTQVGAVFDVLRADGIKVEKGTITLHKKGRALVNIDDLNTEIGKVYNEDDKSNLYLDSVKMDLSATDISVFPSDHLNAKFHKVRLTQGESNYAYMQTAQIKNDKGVELDFNNVKLPVSGISIIFEDPLKAINGLYVGDFNLKMDADQLKKSSASSKTAVLNLGKIQLGYGNVTITKSGKEWLKSKVKSLSFNSLSLNDRLALTGFTANLEATTIKDEKNNISLRKLFISDPDNKITAKKFRLSGSQEVSIDSLVMLGANLDKLFNDKQLDVRNVILMKPDLRLKAVDNTAQKDWSFEQLRKQINDVFPDVRVKKVSLAGANISNEKGLKISELNADLQDVNISENRDWRYKIPFVRNVEASIQEVSLKQQKTSLMLKNVIVDSRNNALKVNHLLYNQTEKNNTIEIPRFEGSIPDLYALVEDNNLLVDRIKLPKPKIEINTKSKSKNNLLEGSSINKIVVNSLVLSRGDLLIKREKDDLDLKDLSVEVEGVKLDARTNLNENLLVFDNIHLNTPNLTLKSKDGLYKWVLGNLKFASKDSSLTVQNLDYSPLLSREDYFKKQKYETDYINTKVGTLKLSGIDLDKFLNRQIIDCRYLLVKDATIDVYRDKNMPDAPAQEKPMYQTLLLNHEKPLNIQGIGLRNIDITYTEWAEDAIKPGAITFMDLKADFKNVTNRKDLIRKNSSMVVDVETNVMGEAPLNLSLTFDLSSKEGDFTLGGKLKPSSLTVYNSITKYNAFIDVKDGYANSLMFSVKGNKKVAYGTMDFYYEDLKVKMLNKETGDAKLGTSIATFFANTFVINRNNPHLFKFRQGKIYFERNPQKSLFNYWTKTFLSGLVASIGVNNNRKEFEKVMSGEPDK